MIAGLLGGGIARRRHRARSRSRFGRAIASARFGHAGDPRRVRRRAGTEVSLVDGRIVGTITATIALIVLAFVALGLYTSLAGLVIAGSMAAIAGAAAGAFAEPARSGRNAAVVAGYIAILTLAYMLVRQR
jgi:riboflavin transporter FmnP